MKPEGAKRETKHVRMEWTGRGMAYAGGAVAGPSTVVDGDREDGPGPMDTLLVALCGCMAADVQMILEKSRVPLEELEIEAKGVRAPTPPRRFEEIRLLYRVKGPRPEDEAKLARAVELSREKYCSVLHSLRSDIDFDVAIERI